MRVAFHGALPLNHKPSVKPAVQFAGLRGGAFGNALLNAAWDGDLEKARQEFAKKDCNPNVATPVGNTGLHIAIIRGHVEMVKLFLAQPGIDLNKANIYGQTPQIKAQWEVDRKNRKNIVQDPPAKQEAYAQILELVKAATSPAPPEKPPVQKEPSREPFSPEAKALIEAEIGPVGYKIVAATVRTLEKLGIIERRS